MLIYAKSDMAFIIKGSKKLRTGLTTGSCAAAAAKAAAIMLLTGEYIQTVTFKSKTGAHTVGVSDVSKTGDGLSCSVTKDAGDDPDVTDGIKIVATVFKTEKGIAIDGGEGIGRVTKPGLKIPVGHAAINPVPLEMIEAEVREVCVCHGYSGGFRILISAPRGAEIAKRTMNERLGIVGGISILGTTGIVEPMSDKALMDTIKAEIDMLIAGGAKTLLVTPGNYGLDFARTELGLDMESAVKCSNFIGEALDYAHFAGIERVTLIGHAGKLIKLAGGIMNTHSGVADCRMEIIAAHCGLARASRDVIRAVMDCVTVDAAAEIMMNNNIHEQVWNSIGQRIGFHLRERTQGAVMVSFIVFTQERGVLIASDTAVKKRGDTR